MSSTMQELNKETRGMVGFDDATRYRFIKPRAHAVLDYVLLATRLGAAGLFYRRNRKASIGCVVNAIVEGTSTVFTDFPGGLVKRISYPAHVKIGFAYAPVIAAMPFMLGFQDESEAMFFYGDAIASTLVNLFSDTSTMGRMQDTARSGMQTIGRQLDEVTQQPTL